MLSPRPEGVRKRKKKEKRRKWVWTIGQDEDENESGAIAALKAAGETSTPRGPAPTSVPTLIIPSKANLPKARAASQTSFESIGSESDMTTDRADVEMSDASSRLSSRATTPRSVDVDMKTPTVTVPSVAPLKTDGLGSADLIDPETGSRRDTPIPPDLVEAGQS